MAGKFDRKTDFRALFVKKWEFLADFGFYNTSCNTRES